MNDRLSTNEFAKMCGVEKRTLFYYDEIDILKPVEVLENGYRMYAHEQFDTMSMIKSLQSVGMSLRDIKNLINEKDLKKCEKTLRNQSELINLKIQQLQQSQYALTETINNINKFTETGCDKEFFEECPEAYLITHKISPDEPRYVNFLNFGYYLGVIMDKDNITIPGLVYKKAADCESANFIKKSGTYISVYKKVSNGSVPVSIDSWFKSIAKQNINVDGSLYIETITNDFLFSLKKDNIFKFSFKVRSNHLC